MGFFIKLLLALGSQIEETTIRRYGGHSGHCGGDWARPVYWGFHALKTS